MTRFAGLPSSDLDEALARCRPALATLAGARIFVTGGTGFVGRWLLALIARAFEEFAIEAVVLTRRPEGFATIAPTLAAHPSIRFARGDVRRFAYPKGRVTHVVHAAADTSLAADADKRELIEVIIGGAQRVADFAKTAGARRLLYVSSGAVYGPQPAGLERIPEDHPGAPDPLLASSAYGEAKRMGELICALAAESSSLEPVIARAFAFVGPGLPLDAHFAIGNFIRDALAAREIVVSGDGTPLRSYLYAADLAVWLVRLLAEGEAGLAYNVGSDEPISICNLAERVSALSKSRPRIVVKGAAQAGAPRHRYVPDISRARALGLDVWTPLDQAISRTMKAAAKG